MNEVKLPSKIEDLIDLAKEWEELSINKESVDLAKKLMVSYLEEYNKITDNVHKELVKRILFDYTLTELASSNGFDYDYWFSDDSLKDLKPKMDSVISYLNAIGDSSKVELDLDEEMIMNLSKLSSYENEPLSSIVKRVLEYEIENQKLKSL